MSAWIVLTASLAYVSLLFAIAWLGDRGGTKRTSPLSYSLTLAVYCRTWTFFGSIERATTGGFDFLAI